MTSAILPQKTYSSKDFYEVPEAVSSGGRITLFKN